MTDTLTRAAARLTAVIDQVADWSAASPCQGWTLAEVVDHLVDTQRDFLAGRGLPIGPRPEGDPAQVWRARQPVLLAAVGDPVVASTSYDGYFGPTTIGDTLATFYGFDLIVHRWDIATGAGAPCGFSTDELDDLDAAIAGFGDLLYAEGICRPGVQAPPGADRQTVLLARLGRTAS